MDHSNDEIKNINDEIERNTNIHEKLAMSLSNKIGSMKFVYILIIFMIAWTSINIGLMISGGTPFDQPYTFTIMLLISNCIQLITPLLILVSQNIQSKRDQAVVNQEYILAKKTRDETKLTFDYLKSLNDQLKIILTKINTQQQKMISLEEKQNQFNEIISQNLMLMLQTMILEIQTKPCLMENNFKNEENDVSNTKNKT